MVWGFSDISDSPYRSVVKLQLFSQIGVELDRAWPGTDNTWYLVIQWRTGAFLGRPQILDYLVDYRMVWPWRSQANLNRYRPK